MNRLAPDEIDCHRVRRPQRSIWHAGEPSGSRRARAGLSASRPRGKLFACLLLACLTLGACNNPGFPLNANGGIGGGIGKADPATRAACTQTAERTYNQRNRAEIYAPQSSVNAPFSANYGAGSTDRGLSDQYARDVMIRDCVRNTGTETNRAVPPAPGTGPVIRP